MMMMRRTMNDDDDDDDDEEDDVVVVVFVVVVVVVVLALEVMRQDMWRMKHAAGCRCCNAQKCVAGFMTWPAVKTVFHQEYEHAPCWQQCPRELHTANACLTNGPIQPLYVVQHLALDAL